MHYVDWMVILAIVALAAPALVIELRLFQAKQRDKQPTAGAWVNARGLWRGFAAPACISLLVCRLVLMGPLGGLSPQLVFGSAAVIAVLSLGLGVYALAVSRHQVAVGAKD